MWSQIPSLGAAPQKGLRSPRCCPDPWGDLLAAVVLGTEACLRLPLSPPGLAVLAGGGGGRREGSSHQRQSQRLANPPPPAGGVASC